MAAATEGGKSAHLLHVRSTSYCLITDNSPPLEAKRMSKAVNPVSNLVTQRFNLIAVTHQIVSCSGEPVTGEPRPDSEKFSPRGNDGAC